MMGALDDAICDLAHRTALARGWCNPFASRSPHVQGFCSMGKRRLDALLAERGLFPSRSRAAASVMAGEVRVGVAERRAQKPGELIDDGEQLHVEQGPAYVSRGGLKLANALDATGLAVAGRRALDVGASTGGFTDCLLQRGVHEVIAVDVGYGTLAWSLRNDSRVTVLERTNARSLQPSMLPFVPDLAVIDVSFISLEKVLGAVLGCLAAGYDALAMIKPQFEVGRERIGKGGVVRDAESRRAALIAVGRAALSLGAGVVSYASSGLPGPKGNRETFLWLTDPANASDDRRGEIFTRERAPELERLAREVEP
jgi:23S rRNA (cytidine1920-2'-O)/16S rRNA (cytidine1409-2'-O)-methyltransferase